jgi:glycosyltransferase involved in cell wall biosynthesis
MKQGGVETWLMHVLRSIDRRRFRMDFLVHTTQPCPYDDEVRSLGADVIPCLRPSRPVAYGRNLRRILRDRGPYDVVHSHVHHFSGYVLRLACHERVRGRVAHCHSDTSGVQAKAGWLRRAYLGLMERWVDRYATTGLAGSGQAAVSLYGPRWQSDPRWQLLPYGIDFAPFGDPPDSAVVRDELGIPRDAFVLGHVGRFRESKNHAFLLDVAAEVARREPKTRLLLVGDGPLKRDIERQIDGLGLTNQVILAGLRPDVPGLMSGAMDVFVFPSFYEGLGNVVLEAQAAGLPCVVSSGIAEEASVVPRLVRRFSLSEPLSAWADAILRTRDDPSVPDRRSALETMMRSRFNIANALESLECVYAATPH